MLQAAIFLKVISKKMALNKETFRGHEEEATQIPESLICRALILFSFVYKLDKMGMLLLWEGYDHHTRNMQTYLECCEVIMPPKFKE